LLTTRRSELLAYLNQRGQPYRSDPSNRDPEFTRNRIRYQLLPRLAEDFNPEVVQAIVRLGSIAGEAQAVIDAVVENLADRCVTVEGRDTVRIDLDCLCGQPSYLARELLIAVWRSRDWPMQSMGLAEWRELAETACATGTRPYDAPWKRVFPGKIVAEVRRDQLLLQRSG
jgi:tRNA(Ile)-lysidine synthase